MIGGGCCTSKFLHRGVSAAVCVTKAKLPRPAGNPNRPYYSSCLRCCNNQRVVGSSARSLITSGSDVGSTQQALRNCRCDADLTRKFSERHHLMQPRWQQPVSSVDYHTSEVYGSTSRRYYGSSTWCSSSSSASITKDDECFEWEWEGCRIVHELASDIRASVRSYTKPDLSDEERQRIKLVGITTSGAEQALVDEDAEAYSEHIATNFEEDGIDYDLWRVPADPQKVEAAIFRAEEIAGVHGVLVFYPIFKKVPNIQKLYSFLDHSRTIGGGIQSVAPGQSTMMFSSVKDSTDWVGKRGPYKNKRTGVYYKTFDDYFRDMIPSSLDVEGLCHDYNARIMSKYSRIYVNNSEAGADESVIFPCTALAVARILESCHWGYNAAAPVGQRLKDCVVTIVNRSEIFGRPLAAMLANDGATVYSVDIDSIVVFKEGGRTHKLKSSEIKLEACVRQSSFVVSAVPNASFQIPVEWIAEKTTLINVAREKNINEDDLHTFGKPGILYIPQVGQVTVALLEQNLTLLHRRFHSN